MFVYEPNMLAYHWSATVRKGKRKYQKVVSSVTFNVVSGCGALGGLEPCRDAAETRPAASPPASDILEHDANRTL
jgi:hypothetical protein